MPCRAMVFHANGVPCTGALPNEMSSLRALSYFRLDSPRRPSSTLSGTLPVGYSELTALTTLSLDHQV